MSTTKSNPNKKTISYFKTLLNRALASARTVEMNRYNHSENSEMIDFEYKAAKQKLILFFESNIKSPHIKESNNDSRLFSEEEKKELLKEGKIG